MNGIKYLIIDSKDRLAHSTSTSDCFFRFNAYGATACEVVSFQCPMTQYNINSTNNRVFFNDGVNRDFTIATGNYSSYDFLTELENQFNNVSSGYTVTYSDISMKITITNVVVFSLLFGTNTTNTSAYILGFNNVDTPFLPSHISNNCINFSLPLYMCCIIDQFSTSVKATDDTPCTFVFMNNVNCGDILCYNEATDYKQCANIYESNIQSLHVRFTVPGGETLDINNADWMMLLRLCYC
jgi:hypothetical protein